MSGSSRAWTTLLLLVACTSLSACYRLVPLPDGVQPEGVTAGEQQFMPIGASANCGGNHTYGPLLDHPPCSLYPSQHAHSIEGVNLRVFADCFCCCCCCATVAL
jgi:hypothetical protein